MAWFKDGDKLIQVLLGSCLVFIVTVYFLFIWNLPLTAPIRHAGLKEIVVEHPPTKIILDDSRMKAVTEPDGSIRIILETK